MKSNNEKISFINKLLKNEIFELSKTSTPSFDSKVKFEITNIKDYISVGTAKPYLEYTLYILPSDDDDNNEWNELFAKYYGDDVKITTVSREYSEYRFNSDRVLKNFLKYIGVDEDVICTRVINHVAKMNLKESLIKEGSYDSITRQLVRDIVAIYKGNDQGEFGLPEDLYPEEHAYEFQKLGIPLQVFVEIKHDESVEGIDVDSDYFDEDEMIYVTIRKNPHYDESLIYPLVGELNEVLRHELEHIKQSISGYKFPKKEPKDPEKYYTQPHELEAQRAGFKRSSKIQKKDYESLVRKWFEDNPQKHNLTPERAEIVIQKILSER